MSPLVEKVIADLSRTTVDDGDTEYMACEVLLRHAMPSYKSDFPERHPTGGADHCIELAAQRVVSSDAPQPSRLRRWPAASCRRNGCGRADDAPSLVPTHPASNCEASN